MKVIVQNLAIEYQDEGNNAGPVLLMLHGWQDNLHTFDAIMPILSADCRIIRVDLPGFGKSDSPKDPWDISRYVTFVQNFIQKLKVDVAILLGHSLGGRITLKGIGTKALTAQKVILIASAGLAKDKTFRSVLTRLAAKIMGTIMYIPPLLFWRKNLRTKLYQWIGSDYINAGSLKETFLKIIAEDLAHYAQAITQPTLLIWGENDRSTPLSDGKKLKKLISNSQLKVLPDAGHFVHQEKANKVGETIKTFLC